LASIPDLAHFFNLVVEPCMKEVSGGDFSLKYLSSHACLTLTPTMMQSGGSFDIIMERYPGEITKGATELVLREAFQDFDLLKMRGLIVDSVYGDSLLTFAVGSEGAINSVFSHLGFFGDHAERYLKIARENLPERDSFIRKAERDCPSIRNFMDLYDQPQVRNATLTSIGIALAHANLPKEISARAPLSVWVSD